MASKRRMRRASVEAVRAASVSFERFWTWWCDYGRESKGIIAGTLSGGNGAGISDILERVASGRRHTAATAIQKCERCRSARRQLPSRLSEHRKRQRRILEIQRLARGSLVRYACTFTFTSQKL